MSSQSSRPSSPASERAVRAVPARGRAVPRRGSRRRLLPVAIAATLAVVVGGLLLVRQSQGANLQAVVTYPDQSRDHHEGELTYAQIPPVGGVHSGTVQNCGIYDQPVSNPNAVHSLEHGAVWITYRPDLPRDQVEQLRALVRGHSHALLSPYPDLPAPIVASAWGLQLRIEGGSTGGAGSFLDTLLGRTGRGTAADSRLALFLDRYERGTQTPEPGATCRGGVGNPIER